MGKLHKMRYIGGPETTNEISDISKVKVAQAIVLRLLILDT